MILTKRAEARHRGTGAIALAVLGLAACTDAPSNSAVASSSTAYSTPSSTGVAETSDASVAAGLGVDDASTLAGVMELHAYHHGGIAHFVSLALDTLGVSADRQAGIDNIQRDLDASTAPAREAERGLLIALADSVSAGKTDAHAVDAALARFTSAVAARNATTDPLNKLHAFLTPVERVALSDKVLAHWDLSLESNADERDGKGRLGMLAEEVRLTPAQVTQIRTLLRASAQSADKGSPDESHAALTKELDTRVRSFATAFSADTYESGALAVGETTDAHVASARARRMSHFFDVAIPALTAPQRVELAARLRDRAGEPATPSTN